MVVNPRSWEAEAGGSLRAQGLPCLQSDFQDSHSITQRDCLETQIKTKQKQQQQEELERDEMIF